MARRAWVVNTFQETFPATPIALLDSGNFSDAPSPAGTVKTRALLEAMGDLGYAAVNVGERDIRFGYDHFAGNVKGSELTFISSNIVDRASGKPIFPPYTVVEARSPDGEHSLRIGVIGAVRFNPIFLQPGPEGREMAIMHPKDQVAAALASLSAEEGIEIVVLLAAMHRDDARRIVAELPGIDFVVGSYGGVFSAEQEAETGSWILYSGNQGKRIGETRLFFDDKRRLADQNTTMHLMTKIYPADPVMLEFVNAVPIPGEHRQGGGAPAVAAPAAPAGGR